jgi:hypothetical protein
MGRIQKQSVSKGDSIENRGHNKRVKQLEAEALKIATLVLKPYIKKFKEGLSPGYPTEYPI